MLRANNTRAVFLLEGAVKRAIAGDYLQPSVEAQGFLSQAYQDSGDLSAAIKSLKVEKALNAKYNNIIREQQFQEASEKLKLEQYEVALIAAKPNRH